MAAACGNGVIQLYQADTLMPDRTLEHHNDAVTCVKFSPDSRQYLASGGYDGQVVIVDIYDYDEYLRIPPEDYSTVFCVRFSRDSTKIAFTADNTIRVWDIVEKRHIATLKGHPKPVRAVVFSPDGKFLYSGAQDRCIRVWDLTENEEIAILEGHRDFVLRLDIHPEGKFLVSCSSDKNVRVWNLEEKTPLSVMSGHTDQV